MRALKQGRKFILPPSLLAALYIGLIATALVATAAAAPGSGSFAEEAARGMGVAAASMLTAQFISSGRIKALSSGVGLDVILGFHRFAASMLLWFVALHVLAFVAPTLAQGPARAGQHLLTLLTSPRMLTGVFAVAGMLAIVVASVKRDAWMKYEVWRLTHGLGALVVLALTGHHVMTTGTASFAPGLWAFWLIVFGAAGVAFAHIYVGRPLLARRVSWRLDAVTKLTPRLLEVTLTQTRGPAFSFIAGQFVWLNFRPGFAQPFDNPFSIASGPEELPRMRFLIKAVGDLTRSLPDLPPGADVSVDGPHGDLIVEGRAARAILLVAGGVGLAPLIGVLRSLAAQGDKRPIRAIYAAGVKENLVYAEEMRAMESQLNLVNFFTVDEASPDWTGGVGPIDATLIRRALDGIDRDHTLALICGPTPMMIATADMIAEEGVPLSSIIYERFAYD
ncbi:MAG: ferredoxin reductase family protein [Beijerinckiaceae bacterium]|nr:ferredoxin reductase family protein [Beijerinckiaceae bacterium]